MATLKNTITKFNLNNGETIDLTISFYGLMMVKSKNKKLYDSYNQVFSAGQQNFDQLGLLTILYVSYLCANISDMDKCMSEEEFAQLVPYDLQYIGEVVAEMVTPKKK